LGKAVDLVREYKFDVDKLIHINPYFIYTPKPETLMQWHVGIHFIFTSLKCKVHYFKLDGSSVLGLAVITPMLLAFSSFFLSTLHFLSFFVSLFPLVFLPFSLSFYDEVVIRVGQYVHIPQRLFAKA
jgi:hypothetical protein